MIKYILRISDGKPGHDSQSVGLCNALSAIIGNGSCTIECNPLPKKLLLKIFCCWVFSIKIKPATLSQPIPFFNQDDHFPILIIGAGHRTHLTLLALKLYFKIPAIVLMKPSLPVSWFDACIIPRHDNPQESHNTIISDGALNPIAMTSEECLLKNDDTTIILIGGTSTHFMWDTNNVIQAIILWVQSRPKHITITLTNSRRTPDNFIPRLHTELVKFNIKNIVIMPYEQTPKGWLITQLKHSSTALITEDSVSMVYEALTAGVAVHLIALQHNPKDKIARNNRYLAQHHYVQFSNAIEIHTLKDAAILSGTLPKEFNESQRIAMQLAKQFKLTN